MLAATAAITSRFLAVGTPRSIGLIGGDDALAELCLRAHAVYFAPCEVRRGDPARAAAADIVCVVADAAAIDPRWLRTGTHVNALRGAVPTPAHAIVIDRAALAAIVAGIRDGRQLDELTIFSAS